MEKINEEMKQKNEEILNRWRNLGFLKGFKEGSINEWRCAKSFENMMEWITEHIEEADYALTTLSFPLIRKVLCTGKNRLHRIIDAETVVDCFKNDTVKECFAYFENDKKTENARLRLDLLKSFIDFVEGWDMPIGKFITELQFPDESDNPLMKSVCIVNSIMDVEAELMCATCEQFKSHFVDKPSDVLSVGDEFETDKGEKMIVSEIDDNGGIIAEYKE